MNTLDSMMFCDKDRAIYAKREIRPSLKLIKSGSNPDRPIMPKIYIQPTSRGDTIGVGWKGLVDRLYGDNVMADWQGVHTELIGTTLIKQNRCRKVIRALPEYSKGE